MHGALLVPHQDVAQLVLLEDGVVDRQDRAAGIAEHDLYAEIDQSANNQFGPGRLGRGVILGIRCHGDLPSAQAQTAHPSSRVGRPASVHLAAHPSLEGEQ